MKEKVDLAAQMMETKLLPTDWIYEQLFHLSEDQFEEYRDLIREDAKRKFRIAKLKLKVMIQLKLVNHMVHLMI